MLSISDITGGLLCLLLLWLIFSSVIKKYDPQTRKLFTRALFFKLFCSVIFSLITAYYYKGGDSEMFFYAVRDMKAAISADDFSIPELLTTEKMDVSKPLSFYFQQDNTKYPVYGFMRSPSNFLVPKLGVIPSFLFFNSYLANCFIFSFFALAGAIRLFKLFLHYFPTMKQEIALATLFLPSVCYWSAGFLKDAICFGSVGFLLYGLLNVFILKRKIAASLFWIALGIYFLYTIKVYILLALIPGIGFWLFGEISSGIKMLALKRLVTFGSLVFAGIGAFMFVQYLTSDAAMSKFSFDNLLESSNFSREIYEQRADAGSNFEFTTTNPVLLLLNGLVATFFRPFPWEVNSLIVLFSAVESLIFLALMVYLFSKKGFLAPVKKIFDTPVLILSLTFAVIFAVSVGISTTNFGSLSRYKIPCLPFYLMFVLGGYHLTGLAYPAWMKKILNFIWSDKKIRTNVRHRRVHQS